MTQEEILSEEEKQKIAAVVNVSISYEYDRQQLTQLLTGLFESIAKLEQRIEVLETPQSKLGQGKKP